MVVWILDKYLIDSHQTFLQPSKSFIEIKFDFSIDLLDHLFKTNVLPRNDH